MCCDLALRRKKYNFIVNKFKMLVFKLAIVNKTMLTRSQTGITFTYRSLINNDGNIKQPNSTESKIMKPSK
ncbi:hypothetical protein ERHA55_52870 (plasmid) [Erwinia rhapontici]|nr:hypothetical protein ERHA55_52870 [Erwinia rhapontici]